MLTRGRHPVVYVAASAHDGRFTRICVASIRTFYPDVDIRLLAGGPLEQGLAAELKRYWNVALADLPRGDYGWGFVKLEPLFGSPGEEFLVVDSDTVMTGPVFDVWHATSAPFVVDDECQSEADTKRLYYDWERIRAIDATARPPQFVFNSGQWFGTSGLLTRDVFTPWVEWSMPRRLRYPAHFMPGDQGVLNYVLNRLAAVNGLSVERRRLMRWPGHGMDGITARLLTEGGAAGAGRLIVHWAGMKRARQQDMKGADVLAYFETQYYDRLPMGRLVKGGRGCCYALATWGRQIGTRISQRLQRTSCWLQRHER